MASITIAGREERVAVTPAVSVLNTLLRAEVAVNHVCGGKAECGTCVIRIVSGAKSASPVLERERTRLRAKGFGPGLRLACQTYCFRDIEIEIPENPGTNGKKP